MAQGQSPVSRTMRARLALAFTGFLGALFAAAAPVAVAAPRDVVLPVPRVTVYPGTMITQDMLVARAFRGKDVQQGGFASNADAVVGKVARKTLLPNVPIAVAGVREPFSVVQGQPAVVVFQSGGLVISGRALPLQNGAAGEVVSLRNTDSGATIRGVVQPDGTVRVGMP
jgi:flagella basal body P-ring formation protein FlgA